jgi:excinuclease UvrABC nuclease subunit
MEVTMGNPKLAMKAELEAKYRHKYEEKLKEAENLFVLKLAEAHANYQKMLRMGMQQSHDAALMAIDDVFDVNEYSAEKFHIAHIRYVNKIASMVVDDDKDDPEIVWTKATVDRRLLQIVGEKNFVPWDERMGGAEDV